MDGVPSGAEGRVDVGVEGGTKVSSRHVEPIEMCGGSLGWAGSCHIFDFWHI